MRRMYWRSQWVTQCGCAQASRMHCYKRSLSCLYSNPLIIEFQTARFLTGELTARARCQIVFVRTTPSSWLRTIMANAKTCPCLASSLGNNRVSWCWCSLSLSLYSLSVASLVSPCLSLSIYICIYIYLSLVSLLPCYISLVVHVLLSAPHCQKEGYVGHNSELCSTAAPQLEGRIVERIGSDIRISGHFPTGHFCYRKPFVRHTRTLAAHEGFFLPSWSNNTEKDRLSDVIEEVCRIENVNHHANLAVIKRFSNHCSMTGASSSISHTWSFKTRFCCQNSTTNLLQQRQL